MRTHLIRITRAERLTELCPNAEHPGPSLFGPYTCRVTYRSRDNCTEFRALRWAVAAAAATATHNAFSRTGGRGACACVERVSTEAQQRIDLSTHIHVWIERVDDDRMGTEGRGVAIPQRSTDACRPRVSLDSNLARG